MEGKQVALNRERQLADILLLAFMSKESGNLTTLPETDKDFVNQAARELSVTCCIPFSGAKRILSVVHLQLNPDLRSYFKAHKHFRVLSAAEFVKANRSISTAGGVLSTDLIRLFDIPISDGTGEDVTPHSPRGLQKLLLQFQSNARHRIMLWFFKFVSIFGTLGGWITPGSIQEENERAGPSSVMDIARNALLQFLSESWNTPSMKKQEGECFSRGSMCDGWNIASEVVKLQIQELHGFIVERRRPGKANKRTTLCQEERITISEVEDDTRNWCQAVLQEFMGWVYMKMKPFVTASDFMEGLKPTVENVYSRLLWELDHTQRNDASASIAFNTSRLHELLRAIDRGAFTLAEVRLDPIQMKSVPRKARNRRTRHWNFGYVVRRDSKEDLFPVENTTTEQDALPAPLTAPSSPEKPRQRQHPVTNPNDSSGARDIHCQNPHATSLHIESDSDFGCSDSDAEMELPNNSNAKAASIPDPRSSKTMTAEPESVDRLPIWLHEASYVNASKNSKGFMRPVHESPRSYMLDGPSNKQMGSNQVSTARSLELIVPVREEKDEFLDIDYAADMVDSDLENRYNRRQRGKQAQAAFGAGERVLSTDLEGFFAEFLTWDVHPDVSSSESIFNTHADWFEHFFKTNQTMIRNDVTECEDAIQYANHWKRLLVMELRGALIDSLSTVYPSMREQKAEFLANLYGTSSGGATALLALDILKVDHSKLLTNFKCESRDKALNTRIVRELSGMTLCVGFLRPRNSKHSDKQDSKLLFFCRRVDLDGGDIDRVGIGANVDRINLRICIARSIAKAIEPMPFDRIHIRPIYSLAPITRMFRAAHMSYKFPQLILDIIFGRRVPPLLPGHVKRPSSIPYDIEDIRDNVDKGCLRYLWDLAADPTSRLDQHQYHSIVIALSGIGEAGPGSSSLSLILGPPGTGKTTCIAMLIGALLHHSIYGHMGGEECHNLLNKKDTLLRCSKKDGALRILVVCGSNQGVDNCLRKLAGGLPDGKGGKIKIQMARVARQDYDYGDLQSYSMNERALQFDHELYHVDEQVEGGTPKTIASSRAKKALAQECIVLFFTNSGTGSSRFSELQVSCDVVVNDEAAQQLEPEALIPMAATRKNTTLQRLHCVAVGDGNQLPAMSHSAQLVRSGKARLPIDYDSQSVSLFERLYNRNRTANGMLTAQYRMHPCISSLHSEPFYGANSISNPAPVENFMSKYNTLRQSGRGYAPLKFLDTCMCKSRLELNVGDGKIVNTLEADQVEVVINTIIGIEGVSDLKGRIAVIAPYRSQIECIRNVLQSPTHLLSSAGARNSLDIVVDTVDAMQGAERDIVIFSCTRSNTKSSVGFLSNWKRLNVAVSRAKKLLVLIGDSETICSLPTFSHFIEKCRAHSHASNYVVLTPKKGDELAGPLRRGTNISLLRRRGGYSLRSDTLPAQGGIAKPAWAPRNR